MTTQELNIKVLTDLSDIELKVSQTMQRLPEEVRHQFVDGVRGLLLNRRVRCVRCDELIGELIPDVTGAAPGTLKSFAFRVRLNGLDELCASALRAAHGDVG